MLSFDTTHAITGCLVHAEAAADTAGWGQPPLLALLHDQPHRRGGGSALRRIRAELVPIQPDDLADHPTGLPGHLTDIAQHYAVTGRGPAGQAVTLAALHTKHSDRTEVPARALAWAILYEDITTDADGPTEVRRVDAVDTDGRVYQLSRHRSEPTAVVLVDEQPHPADTPATVPALTALLSATAPTAAAAPAALPSGARLLTAREAADLITTGTHAEAATGNLAMDQALIAMIHAGHVLACQLPDGRISFTRAVP